MAGTTMTGADVVARMKWRYATKEFDPAKPVSADDWASLEQALVLAPSSFGLQPWRFIVVTDQATKAWLLPASWNQAQIVDASHVVVFATRTELVDADIDDYIARISEVRGLTIESQAGYRRMMAGYLLPRDTGFIREWGAKQTYIALGTLMTAAAMIGVDVCPIEGFDPAKYDEILGLTAQGYTSVVVAAAGHRTDGDKYARLPKVRYPNDRVVSHV